MRLDVRPNLPGWHHEDVRLNVRDVVPVASPTRPSLGPGVQKDSEGGMWFGFQDQDDD